MDAVATVTSGGQTVLMHRSAPHRLEFELTFIDHGELTPDADPDRVLPTALVVCESESQALRLLAAWLCGEAFRPQPAFESLRAKLGPEHAAIFLG
jgi:hypothetical protein